MEVTGIKEHDDGSATYDWEMTQEEHNTFAAIGAKTMMYCLALGISMDELWGRLEDMMEGYK